MPRLNSTPFDAGAKARVSICDAACARQLVCRCKVATNAWTSNFRHGSATCVRHRCMRPKARSGSNSAIAHFARIWSEPATDQLPHRQSEQEETLTQCEYVLDGHFQNLDQAPDSGRLVYFSPVDQPYRPNPRQFFDGKNSEVRCQSRLLDKVSRDPVD